MRLRDLPSVDELLRDERLASVPHEPALAAAREALSRAREEIRAGAEPGDLVERALAELESARKPRLRRALNATGVIVHTNLGRAPLAEAALERVVEVGRGYSNLELELEAGTRGSRQDHLADILRRLTGAEAALVVNNCAGALLLALAALAEGREVLVSRGELIEIGDGFRIPDVLERSGARLVEVGTTNRTRAADYERAVGPETAALLAVHQSNFRVVGFTERPRLAELAAVAADHALPLVDDLGSGAFAPFEDEPTARESLAAGADLVTFSGDKLLGGPQAGIVVGRADLVERLRRHPLQRALRADKLTLAALEGTLALYLDPERAAREVPVLRMLREPVETCAHGPSGSRSSSAARSRRRSPASAAARCRSRSCRASPAPSRRSWPPRSAAASRRSSPSSATDAACSTAARSPTPRWTRRRLRSPAPADERPLARRPHLGADARRAHDTRARDRRRPPNRTDARGRTAPARRARAETGADADTLHRVLRALASDGVFEEVEPGVFANTAASEVLTESGWDDFAHLFGGVFYRALAELGGTTVEAPFPRVFGTDFWGWLAAHPDERAAFDRAMEQGKERRLERLASVEWRGDETIVDVGGGNGSLLVELLRLHPGLRGIVFDLPETVRDETALGDRIEFVAGSFFDKIPPGDVHVLCTILHDWDDESAAAILRTIHTAAHPGGRLVILDGVVPAGNTPDGPKWLDLLMLALFGGRERNEEQWRALLAGAGFEVESLRDGLIEARCR